MVLTFTSTHQVQPTAQSSPSQRRRRHSLRSAAYVGEWGEDADSDFTGCFSKVESRAGVLMIQYDGERYLVTVRNHAHGILNH